MVDSRPLRRFVPLVALFCAGVTAAATITVNSLVDAAANDGACTLREAIIAANTDTASGAAAGECAAGSAADTIAFGVAGTLRPTSGLPQITTPVHVDGYTAPGAQKNTLLLAQGTNAVLTVEIDGVDAGNIPGLALFGAGASGSIVEGLVIGNSANRACCAQHAILVSGVGGPATTTIRGNFLGTDPSGTEIRSKGRSNIYVAGTVRNLVIGSGPTGLVDNADRNLISGANSDGITVDAAENLTIRGNLIGTDAGGTAPLRNSRYGVFAGEMESSLLANNVISGNDATGLYLYTGTSATVVRDNFIGTNAAGTGPLPNGEAAVQIADNHTVSNTTIANIDFQDNFIAYHPFGGIVIGLANSANTTTGVRLARNLLFGNSGLQIDLAPSNTNNNGYIFGATANDAGDADTGPNALQNFPALSAASGDGTTVSIPYTLDSEPGQSYTLEFFQAPSCAGNVGDRGNANVYLGSVAVTTDGAGHASGTANLGSPLTSGSVSATATHPANGTSELSPCALLTASVAPPPAISYQALWWKSIESGWGINLNHQGDIIFATWFTYDQDGKPWWLVAVLQKAGPGVYSGDVSAVTGPPFNAVPFDSADIVETLVGTMTITFAAPEAATLAYTVNGTSQTKEIAPHLFGPAPACAWGGLPSPVLATNYQGVWWNAPAGSESGWGINFTHQGDVIFATWFTYDQSGKPWWLAAVLIMSAPGVYSGELFTTTASPFDAEPWNQSPVVETTVGTATVSFTDGNNAAFTYTVDATTQTKLITRQVFAGPGTVCQ